MRLALAGAQIPVELVESWLFDDPQGRFQVERVPPVYLSMHGFAALAQGACELACTDRRIEPRELAEFGARPVAGRRVAFYGYALYVHPDNPLDSLYAGHLKLLLQKKISDWKELGGRAGPIRLLGPRKATRGGEILMRQANIWFADPTWEVRASDVEIIDAVAADPSALGFAAVGFDQGVRYLGLRMDRNDPPAFPSVEEIESERYGLAKVIYVYYTAPPGPNVRAALDYLFSDGGRRAIESTHVWPIAAERSVCHRAVTSGLATGAKPLLAEQWHTRRRGIGEASDFNVRHGWWTLPVPAIARGAPRSDAAP